MVKPSGRSFRQFPAAGAAERRTRVRLAKVASDIVEGALRAVWRRKAPPARGISEMQVAKASLARERHPFPTSGGRSVESTCAELPGHSLVPAQTSTAAQLASPGGQNICSAPRKLQRLSRAP